MLKEAIPLKPIIRLQILKCVMCEFRLDCNILTKYHTKDQKAKNYFNELIKL